MREAVGYAHERGVKVYVTANIFAHNYDLEGIKRYFGELKNTGVDAVLVSDPGVFMIAREEMPDMEIHISTQANNTNYMTYKFWYEHGAKRVVSARELSLTEISEIRANIPDDMEIERLSTVQCVFHIQEDVCSATILQEEMPITVRAHIRAAGSIR